MTTQEKDKIIRELLQTIDGLRAEIKDLREQEDEGAFPDGPTRTMGGRAFVRGCKRVPGVIQP